MRYQVAAATVTIEDVRQCGPEVRERLLAALDAGVVAYPDPRHPHAYIMEWGDETFYIAPLSDHTIALLAHWRE